jgi:hypothetical protein
MPLLGAVPFARASDASAVSPAQADALLGELTSEGPAAPGATLLLRHREAAQALRGSSRGRRLLLVSAGPADAASTFLHSFLNIYARDTGDPCVLVDCASASPVVPAGDAPRSDVCDLLLGRARWSEVRQARSPARAFDVVSAPSELTVEKVRAFKSGPTRKLLEALERTYASVFVRALASPHHAENATLATGATDVVVCIVAGTPWTEVDDVLRHVDRSKLRGFLLVGAPA